MKEWVKRNQKYAAFLINLTHWTQAAVLIVIVVEAMIVTMIKIDMIDCLNIKEEP